MAFIHKLDTWEVKMRKECITYGKQGRRADRKHVLRDESKADFRVL